MAAFAKGQVVKVNSVIPSGPVQKMRMDEDGVISYLIEWTDVNGNTHERWFEENELVAG
jgi:uncharacterized protein YodC (DUF2158 family)